MTKQIVWATNGKILDGKLDEFQSLTKRLAEAVHANEAGTLTYEFFLTEDQTGFDLSLIHI